MTKLATSYFSSPLVPLRLPGVLSVWRTSTRYGPFQGNPKLTLPFSSVVPPRRRSLDENLHSPPAGATYAECFAANAWRLWRIDVTRPQDGATAEQTTPPTSCCGTTYVVDAVPFGQSISGDTATLVDLSGDTPVPTISVRGFIADVVRLR